MNKALFAKVKEKTKDTRLSEKYLKAITERHGGSIEDDSTDEEDIERTATFIAEVAIDAQAEATRWAQNAKKGNPKTKPSKGDGNDTDDDTDDDDDSTDTTKGKGKGKHGDNSNDERIAALEKELAEVKAERTRGARMAEINAAFEKHKIPAFLRDRLGKSIADDEDVETAVAALKQDCITNGLISDKAEGSKAASDKQVDEAADALLESITAK